MSKDELKDQKLRVLLAAEATEDSGHEFMVDGEVVERLHVEGEKRAVGRGEVAGR